MVAFTKYPSAIGALLKGINVSTDTFKVALASAVNTANTTFVAGTTDLATGGGYTQGGKTAAFVSATVTAGVLLLILSDPSAWVSDAIAGFTFRYVILYDSTTSDLIGYWDNGSNIVMSSTQADTFLADLDQTNGVFSATGPN